MGLPEFQVLSVSNGQGMWVVPPTPYCSSFVSEEQDDLVSVRGKSGVDKESTEISEVVMVKGDNGLSSLPGWERAPRVLRSQLFIAT